MDKAIIDQIESALVRILNEEGENDQWITQRTEARADQHQFVLFLKPEITAVNSGVDLKRVLELVLSSLDRFDVTVGAIRLLGSRYLRLHDIMAKHYGVINKISRLGEEALSHDALTLLRKTYEDELAKGAVVIGGDQFLAQFESFSPWTLNVLTDNLGTKKLGGGTYCTRINVDGRVFLVLNPFHPYQLEYFTEPGKAIVIFEGLSNTRWETLRKQLTGATNPFQAEAGSIRRALLDQKQSLGVGDIDQGRNGVHLSAGPLEGMVEYQRFFSDYRTGLLDLSTTSFGQLLLSKSIPREKVQALAENPQVTSDGKSVSVFDLTEETDAAPAASRLAEVTNQVKG